MRRYVPGVVIVWVCLAVVFLAAVQQGGGLYKLNPVRPIAVVTRPEAVEENNGSAWFQPLNLSSEKLDSKFAFSNSPCAATTRVGQPHAHVLVQEQGGEREGRAARGGGAVQVESS